MLCIIPSLATATHNHKLFSLLHQQRDIATTTSRYLLVAILSMASSTAPSASVLLALLKEKGFDPDEMNKACRVPGGGSSLWTPMNWFVRWGNLQMCRFLLSHGADCRKRDSDGWFPLLWAASCGHLEIMEWLSHECGAHEDIWKVDFSGNSPLRLALRFAFSECFDTIQWLIRKQALSIRASVEGGGVDDAMMRRDFRQGVTMGRKVVLEWAQNAVTTHDTVTLLLLTGTIIPASSFRRHPNNPYATRSNKRRKKSSSPLVMFKGKSGILELIAHYVSGTQQELRTLRQLLERLPAYIVDVPFVVEDENGGE